MSGRKRSTKRLSVMSSVIKLRVWAVIWTLVWKTPAFTESCWNREGQALSWTTAHRPRLLKSPWAVSGDHGGSADHPDKLRPRAYLDHFPSWSRPLFSTWPPLPAFQPPVLPSYTGCSPTGRADSWEMCGDGGPCEGRRAQASPH